MKQKRTMGFSTPSSEIESKFAEIDKLLNTKKIQWVKLQQSATINEAKFKQGFEAERKSGESSTDLMVLQTRIREHWRIIRLITLLGVEISDTQERLNSIEKAIEQLKLRTK